MIRRAFADLPERQVHFRSAGTGDMPLVMLHASPGSAKQLDPLIGALASRRRVIAPDTPGNGDSTPLAIEHPSIQDYAAAVVAFLDEIGVDTVDLYGSHTGSSIAAEIAILAPGRVRKIVMDGIGIFSDVERDEYLAHYAPHVIPDLTGAHLQWAFMFCRDQYLFWPWYQRNAENRRAAGLPNARSLHNWVLEVLKAIETYHLAYEAAFQYPAVERLPLVPCPVLAIAAENDPLLPHTRHTITLAKEATLRVLPSSRDPQFLTTVADTMIDFLQA